MRVISFQLIKSCCSWIVPAAETKSIGLRADALATRFLLAPRLFRRDTKLAAVYLDLVPFHNFTVTLGFASVYRDWQKTRHRDADGT
jgi:hypothetical protein